MKKFSQNELVYEYMKSEGSITSREAFYDLGVSRLSARIYDLRSEGKPIKTVWKKVPDRYGNKCFVKAYSIGEESNAG